MSTLYWLKVARKAKLYKQPEYPNFEALLEAESEQPSDDYQMAARFCPPFLTLAGVVFGGVMAVIRHNPSMLLISVLFGAVATVLWFVFTSLDRRIARSRVLVRKRAKEIAQRICGFSNIIGVEPAIVPYVGYALEEASRIYMKHRTDTPTPETEKAITALELAMARIMELAVPTAHGQELELQKGWALPLVDEMRETERVLDEHARRALFAATAPHDEPFAKLQQARLELQGYDHAVEELEQKS